MELSWLNPPNEQDCVCLHIPCNGNLFLCLFDVCCNFIDFATFAWLYGFTGNVKFLLLSAANWIYHDVLFFGCLEGDYYSGAFCIRTVSMPYGMFEEPTSVISILYPFALGFNVR